MCYEISSASVACKISYVSLRNSHNNLSRINYSSKKSYVCYLLVQRGQSTVDRLVFLMAN
jgi:hypothetical protein